MGFSLPWRAEKSSDAHPASCLIANNVLSRIQSGRRVKFVTDFPSSTKVKNKWICTSFPPICPHVAERGKKYFFPDIFDLLGNWAAFIDNYWRFGTTYRSHLQGTDIPILLGLLENLHWLVPIAFPSTWYTDSNRLLYLVLPFQMHCHRRAL
jgi:hypothetical protein